MFKKKEIIIIFFLAVLVTGVLFFGGYKFTFSALNIFTWILALGTPLLALRVLQRLFGKSGFNLLQKLISLLFSIGFAIFVLVLVISIFIPARESPSKYGLTSITVLWEEGRVLTQNERFNFIKDLDRIKSTKNWQGGSYLVTNTKKISALETLGGRLWLYKNGDEIYQHDLGLGYPTLALCGEKLCVFGLDEEHFVSKKWWHKIPGFGDLWWGLNPALQATGPEAGFIILVFPDEKGYFIDNNPCSSKAIDSFRILEEDGIQIELLCKDNELHKSLIDVSRL